MKRTKSKSTKSTRFTKFLAMLLAISMIASVMPVGMATAAGTLAIKATVINKFVEIGTPQTIKVTDDKGAELSGATITYETSDAATATVDAAGVVTGVKIGNAAITVTATVGTDTGSTVVDIPIVGNNLYVTNDKNLGRFPDGIVSPWTLSGGDIVTVEDGATPLFPTDKILRYAFNGAVTKPTVCYDDGHNIAITPMKLYEVSAWLKVENIEPTVAAPQLFFETYFYTAPTKYDGGKSSLAPGNQQATKLSPFVGKQGPQDWALYQGAPSILNSDTAKYATPRFKSDGTGSDVKGDVLLADASFHEVSFKEIKFIPSASTTGLGVGATINTSAIPMTNTGNIIKPGNAPNNKVVPIVITYESSAPAVATVSDKGVITTVGGGSANITATTTILGETRVATIAVTVDVSAKPLTSVSLTLPNAPSGRFAIKTVQPTAIKLLDADGTEIIDPNATKAYTVQPQNLASVDASGNITALAEGSGTLEVNVTAGGVTKSASVNIEVAKSGENLLGENSGFETVNPWAMKQTANRTMEIATMAKDGRADNKAFKVTLNPAENGKINDAILFNIPDRIALKAGRLYQFSAWVKAANVVKPADAPAAAYILCGVDMYGYKTSTGMELTGETYRGQDVKLPNAAYDEWKQITLNIAAPLTVDQYVSPRFPIDVRGFNDKKGFGGEVYIDDIEIREVGFDKVDIVPNGAINNVGDIMPITVAPFATTGTPIRIKAAQVPNLIDLKSSSATIATAALDTAKYDNFPILGKITAQSIGSCDITADVTIGGIKRTGSYAYKLESNIPVLKSVALTLPKDALNIAETMTATVAGTLSNDLAANLSGATVTYTSAKPAVATVTDAGVVTAVGEGSTDITVSVTLDGITKTDKKTLNVIDSTALTSVAVVDGLNGGTLATRGTTQLVVSGVMASGKPAYMPNATIAYTVKSGDTVVSVSGTGLVAGLAPGEATIEAAVTLRGTTIKQSVIITVEDKLANNITFDFHKFNSTYVDDVKLMKYADTGNTWEFDSCSENLKEPKQFRTQPYGIQIQSGAIGQFGALRVMVNSPGYYNAKFTHGASDGGGIMTAYLAPVSVPAAERTADKYKIGSADCYSKAYNPAVTDEMLQCKLETAGEYVLTLVATGKNGGSWGYGMMPGILELERFAFIGDDVRKNIMMMFTSYNSSATKPKDLTIAKDGFEINVAKTSEYAFGLARFQVYGLQMQTRSPNIARDSDTAIDFKVETPGPYSFEFSGGKYGAGGISNIYVDNEYVGTYNFNGPNIALGETVSMRSVDLTGGVHTITVRTVDKAPQAESYNQYIGAIKLRAIKTMPTITSVDSGIEKTKLAIGEKQEINAKITMSDDTVCSFGGNNLDGTPNDKNSIEITSSAPDVLEIKDGVMIPKAAGTANVVIKVKVGGEARDVTTAITVTNDKLASIDVSVDPLVVFAGTKAVYSVVAKLSDKSIIDNSNITISATSSDTNIFTVDGSTINALSAGTAKLSVSATMGETTVVKEVEVAVTGVAFSDVILSATNQYLGVDGTANISFVCKDNTGNVMSSDGATATYATGDKTVVIVDNVGMVAAVGIGKTAISVSVTLNGVTVKKDIEFSVSAGKHGPSFYTEDKIAAARENVKIYPWAATQLNNVKADAEQYVGKQERLWDIVTAEGVPRGITVGFQNDPNAYTCAACGKDLRAFAGSYPWISDPLNKPWKIQCPSCRRYFPSNDFEGFYKLGLQPNGTFDVKAAHTKNDELIAAGKTGFLKNIENPDWDNQFNTKDWGVDDGFGYKTGVVFPNRVVESKTWIAYYNHWGLWYPNGKNNVAAIYSGVKTLSEAYLYTGDARYGRVGAILLDRVADVYPEYNLLPYFGTFYNSHGGTGEGKTIGRIWETESAKVFALAYDIFYPMYDDPQVVDFLNNKAISAGLVNKKETPSAIRKNCEDGILRATFEGCKDASIWGNFGSHQETLATAAVVLDTMPETKEWIDWTMQAGGINGHTVSGGNVLAQIVDQVNRDGHGMEAAPSYNKIWITGIVKIAEALKDYKGYAGANLYDNPKVGQMVKSLTAITEGSNATVAYGDSGATAQIGLYAPRTEMLAAYQSTKDPEMAQILYWLADGKVDTLHGDICMKDPESIQKDIADTVEQYGETDLLKKSLNQAGNGFAILRDGEYIKSNTASETINTQQDFWMYYGRNLGHGHPDTLNLGMAAFGINMAPELGYPEATGSDPNRAQWINNTISHNTVVVNEQKQTNIPDAAKPLHFDDAGQVKLMDVDSPSSYKGTTDIYRRTVVSVKADPTTSYSVDFFRIKGGDDHTYSFHSQSKEIFETEGLKFKEQKDASGEWVGTYAGADVAWGANSKYMNGYSWLKKVRRADKPGTGEFAVDFKITDFRTVLPYPQDLHLRMTMLNDFDLNEVSIVEGTPPRLKGNPDALEYVLARRNGKNLDSLFTTVYEPYKDDRYIESMAQVPTTIVSGKPGKADTVKAVKVTLKNGRIDYVVYATNNSVMYRVDDKFDFRGFVGVYMMKDGKVLSTYINDGDVIGDKTSVTSDYTGRVVDFTKGLVLNNSITVQMDGNVDPQSLVGRYVYIDNGAATGNAVYPIESATEANGRLVFGLGSVTLVNTYKDVNNMAKGFNYNIAEGQKFRIPMSAMDDATPVFANIGKQKATAGHIFNLRVAAVSPIDSKLTYEAVAIPAGAQFNAETQEIKWTPSDGQVGNNAFRFSVTDGLFTATLNFMVEVGPGTGGGTGGSGTGDGTGDGKPPEEKPDEKPKPPTEKVTAKDFTVKAADSAAGITEIKSDAGSITLRTGAFEKDAKGTFRITTKGDDIKVSLLVDGAEYKSDEMMEITINYVPSAAMPDPRCIVLKDKDGNIIANGEYKDGKVTFMTNALGEFTVGYNPKTFSDMGSHSWAEDAVISLAARGIINGTSEEEYSPGDNITRADFTTLVVRTLKLKVDKTGKNFDDIEPGAYYADAVAIAKALGIVGGQGDNKFNAMAEISREDMMVIMSRALLIAGYIFGGEPEHEDFKDAGDISDYAKEAIEMLVSSGLIAGNNGRINPKGKTTRAEVAVLLSRVVFG